MAASKIFVNQIILRYLSLFSFLINFPLSKFYTKKIHEENNPRLFPLISSERN